MAGRWSVNTLSEGPICKFRNIGADSAEQSIQASKSPMDRGNSLNARPNSPYLPSILEDPEAEEQEAKRYEETLQQNDEWTSRRSWITGDTGIESYFFDSKSGVSTLGEKSQHHSKEGNGTKRYVEEDKKETQEALSEEQHQGSFLEGPRHAEDDNLSIRKSISLASLDLGNKSRHDRNQDSTEKSHQVARDVGKSVPLYSAEKTSVFYNEAGVLIASETKLSESTSSNSDVSTNTSVSSRSESSNQSTPRSPVTTSVSENAESFNSKASTATDVSDTDSNDDSDKSEVEDDSTRRNIGVSTPSDPSRISMTKSNNANWHNLIPAREQSLSTHQAPIASTPGNQSLVPSQGSRLHDSYSSAQSQERTRSQQYFIPRLPILAMRSLGSRRLGLEDSLPLQSPFMVSRPIPRRVPGKSSMPTWDSGEGGDEGFQKEPS